MRRQSINIKGQTINIQLLMERIKLIKSRLLIPALLLLVLNSCKHEDLQIAKENQNFRLAADFIKNNYDMTLFYAALQKTGMIEVLKGAGPFTILVPNNAAFQQLGISKPADFDKLNVDSLKALVQLHILKQRLLFADVPANGVDIRYPTLSGIELYTSVAGFSPGNSQYPANELYFDGSTVINKDITIANGVIQVLNKVMKYTPKSTVQDWLAKRPQYSIFVSGLKKFGLWDKLANPGTFTVFAPQNTVFTAANITETTIAGLDTSIYSGAKLFGSYILNNKHLFISDLRVFSVINNEQMYIGQLTGADWYLKLESSTNFQTGNITYNMHLTTALIYPYQDYPAANGLLPALTDNLTDNGLVHDVQGLLLLPEQAQK